ncbi:30S ribosomal protein S21 [Hibiscus syriacus]|uniref:30S ribosomal protein S21 n=1 Tax=Hibiscus syriacus TaxID=106335 RepID=A0A6A2WSD4_HIBSY|nr:30S ribosomal protein S21, chloroplastic-like [Hibiscus syriacus]KAE8663381.1 30S ribosomal protein S21 [Hibiscus syriacus]
MAFSLTSLSKSLSSLLPSQSIPPKPSDFAPPVSQWDPKSTWAPTSLSLSLTAADEINAVTCPSLAYSNTLFFKSVCYNVQVVVAENEPEEKLLGRFRRAVFKAGVVQECKRRMFFESSQEKKKRKAREASRRNRKRRFKPKAFTQAKEEGPKKNDDEDDNWDLPEGDLPY